MYMYVFVQHVHVRPVSGMVYLFKKGGNEMPRTAAANKSQYKYNKNNLKRIPLDVQIEYYEGTLKPAAEKARQPINTYIKQAINERIEREQ